MSRGLSYIAYAGFAYIAYAGFAYIAYRDSVRCRPVTISVIDLHLPEPRMTKNPEPKPTPAGETAKISEPIRQIVAAAAEPPPSHLGTRLHRYLLNVLL